MDENFIFKEIIHNISPTTRKITNKRKYTFIKRIQRIQTNRTNLHLLLKESAINIIRKNQCNLKCLDEISNQKIIQIRREYLLNNELDKNKWIRNYLQNNKIMINEIQTTRWHLDGSDICKSCWLSATTISSYKLKFCNQQSHGSSGIPKINSRLNTAISWLSNYFNTVCEKMPTKNELHLPCFIIWNDINNDLNQYLSEQGYKKISSSFFTKVSKRSCVVNF
jgi:hypothetical protein